MKRIKIRVFFLSGIVLISPLFFQYVVNTKYSFPEPHAFKGDHIYNPYNDMNSKKWEIANFHAHTRVYLGLTNGAANSNQFLDSFYKYFNYNIIGISNYQEIDTFESKNKWFIPVYEHGYQYYKNHQLVINARNVNWLDYFFRQTLSNKQNVIDHLKEDKSVILTIVHPERRKAYLFNDFRYLGNYDCLEIANNQGSFTSYYDTILSAGHPVFLMADDDAHDLSRINNGCRSFNMISTDLVRDSILHAIKSGCLVGVSLNIAPYETNEAKRYDVKMLPEITGVNLKNDTLTVSLNKPVRYIRFIGQQGAEKMKILNVSAASYPITKQDTYIRTEIQCHDGTIYYLNPVFRYNGLQLTDHAPAPDLFKTNLCRLSVLVFFMLIIAVVRYRNHSPSKSVHYHLSMSKLKN